ncbi:glucosaminidase domain-containing protein [Candidatus Saccharibacteria bacterium]|nr:glucosaminidase domain-containing protein [Candidatus Saccharibacteria bacterium]
MSNSRIVGFLKVLVLGFLNFVLILSASLTESVGATSIISDDLLQKYSAYDIYFYNVEQDIVCDFTELAEIESINGSDEGVFGGAYNTDRLRWATGQYGEYAMEAQKKYGVPWEVVIAQMAVESSVGTKGIAVSGATNNWLGITGSGDAGVWYNSKGRAWAKFSSVEASIDAWAGRKVLRNGYYNDAFQYLDPNNYNLHAFLKVMISHYAPSSDGNNEAVYVSNVEKFINGSIRVVRQEKGWPSSAELAARENIPIGGQYPIGSSIGTGGSGSSSGGGSTDSEGFIEPSACLDQNEGGKTPEEDGAVDPKNLTSGGMTLAEAQSFMQPYITRARRKETGTIVFDGATVNQPSFGSPPDGTLNNCSAFSQWFVNRYTSATVGLYQGSATARTLITSGKGFIDGGHTPKVYAVMSSQKPNHTGVVLGIDTATDTIIIGEASYHNGINGYPRAKAYSLNKYSSSNYTYAYTDNILRGL